MSIGKLLLYPRDSVASPPEAEELTRCLRALGLIGQPLGANPTRFVAGEQFLQLISFVGCSPNVCLAPQDASAPGFCHLSIYGPCDPAKLVFASACRPPLCPACQLPLTGWKAFAAERKIRCSQCEVTIDIADITWGRRAGYGRMFIEIHNIFPGEARPVAGLFKQLQQETGLEWDYFFTETAT